jgi:hypothetical protein
VALGARVNIAPGNCTLEWVSKKSNLIADVTIIEWLGESLDFDADDMDFATYFLAKVNRTIKGEERDTIVIRQSGNSQSTLVEDPLYRNGDRLLLFLYEIPDERVKEIEIKCSINFKEDVFGITGMHLTPLIIQENEGKNFVFSRFDVDYTVGESLSKDDRIKAADSKMTDIIFKNYIDYDPLISNLFLERAQMSGFSAKNHENFKSEYAREYNDEINYRALLEDFNCYHFGDVYGYNDVVERITEFSKEVENNEKEN